MVVYKRYCQSLLDLFYYPITSDEVVWLLPNVLNTYLPQRLYGW